MSRPPYGAPPHIPVSLHAPYSMTTALRHKSTSPSHMHYNAKPKGFKEVGRGGWTRGEGREDGREGGAGVSMWWCTTHPSFLPDLGGGRQ